MAWFMAVVAASVLSNLAVALIANLWQALVATTPQFLALFPTESLGWTIVFCAVCRVILRPENSRIAYLRIGPDEMRLFPIALVFVGLLRMMPPWPSTPPDIILQALLLGAVLALSTPFSLIPAAVFNLGLPGLRAGFELARGRFRQLLPVTLGVGLFVVASHWAITAGLMAYYTKIETGLLHGTFPIVANVVGLRLIAAALNTAAFVLAAAPLAAAYARLRPPLMDIAETFA
jgi:hypothetical protein